MSGYSASWGFMTQWLGEGIVQGVAERYDRFSASLSTVSINTHPTTLIMDENTGCIGMLIADLVV